MIIYYFITSSYLILSFCKTEYVFRLWDLLIQSFDFTVNIINYFSVGLCFVSLLHLFIIYNSFHELIEKSYRERGFIQIGWKRSKKPFILFAIHRFTDGKLCHKCTTQFRIHQIKLISLDKLINFLWTKTTTKTPK